VEIERIIKKIWPLYNWRSSGFWWSADKLVDYVERIFIKKMLLSAMLEKNLLFALRYKHLPLLRKILFQSAFVS